MTITLKPWMTVLLVATICILLGFAVGQVTSAQSTKSASVSNAASRQIVNQLKQTNRTLNSIKTSLGTSNYGTGIMRNTYKTCAAVKDSAVC